VSGKTSNKKKEKTKKKDLWVTPKAITKVSSSLSFLRKKMEFTLAEVRDCARVYLAGARARFVENETADFPEFVWDDSRDWDFVEYYIVNSVGENLWSVSIYQGDCVSAIEEDVTAEQVVEFIRKDSGGVSIEKIM
jgi:hypothetical protein